MTNSTEETNNIPRHVGLILDGNRRWARERGLSTLDGHMEGEKRVREAPRWFLDRGVEIVTVYAFSTENWKRKKEEVEYLMDLLKRVLKEETKNAIKKGHKVLISGRIGDLPGDLPARCREVMEKTRENAKGIFNICLNYGGRTEIVDAVRTLWESGIEKEAITEEAITNSLYHPEVGDPDIIVRTSGEKRLSGFQLWESAYSELMFLDKYWPDFAESDAEGIIKEFSKRKRRFGGS
jgi:undecaprenyl diphosphate synthase